jgi:holo-[acyl-carrier protein] synthase
LIGIDIIEIERIRAATEQLGARFLRRVYTTQELSLYASSPSSLAAHFAAKESVMKALGGELFNWREIEVLSLSSGQPVVNLSGQARKRAKELGLASLEVSLSHTKEYAIAVAIGIKN